jgi:hypothetical protein
MPEGLIEIALCALIGLAAFLVVAWDIATGHIAYMDGICLALISLALGVFFLFNVRMAWRSGELKNMLASWKKRKKNGSAGSSSQAA